MAAEKPGQKKKQELPPALRANADKLKKGEPLASAKRKRKTSAKTTKTTKAKKRG